MGLVTLSHLPLPPASSLWRLPLQKLACHVSFRVFRCKGYGHRTGDRECPMNMTGNLISDAERQVGRPGIRWRDWSCCLQEPAIGWPDRPRKGEWGSQ